MAGMSRPGWRVVARMSEVMEASGRCAINKQLNASSLIVMHTIEMLWHLFYSYHP